MGTNLTSTQLGDLRQLFNTPVDSGGDGNAYNPNVVNYNGQSWKQDGQGGYVGLSDLFGDNEYNFTNYKPDGNFMAEGVGRMTDWDPFKEFLMATAGLVGGGLAMGGGLSAFTGAGNPVLSGLSNTGAVTSGTAGLTGATTAGVTAGAELSGAALDTALGEASTTAMEAYGGSTAAAQSQVSGILEMGGTLSSADVATIGKAAGLTGSDLVKFVATNASKVIGDKKDSSGGIGLDDIIKLAGGITDKNAQEDASNNLLTYLRERQDINDNMYKPGSPEYNALWDEMSRKDAAAGRNSQYGPRSVDLAARVAGLKMDANTKMTTGIGALYKAGLDKDATSHAGLSTAIGDILKNGGTGLDWLDDFDLGDITDWIGDLFKD